MGNSWNEIGDEPVKAKLLLIAASLDETIWGKRIIRAEKRGYFTTSDNGEARNWNTCACGKQDKRLLSYGKPKDFWLYHWGCVFSDQVGTDHPLGAAKTLIKIEKRAAKILAWME